MSHYLNDEEIKAKTEEVNRLQEDENYCLSLVFRKDEQGWAAEVPTHTRSENAMVFGADVAIERMSHGDNTVEVKFRTVKSAAKGEPVCWMSRFIHNGSGATYLVHGLAMIPFPAFLCNVTHDVTGEHPEKIFVYEINHYNK